MGEYHKGKADLLEKGGEEMEIAGFLEIIAPVDALARYQENNYSAI